GSPSRSLLPLPHKAPRLHLSYTSVALRRAPSSAWHPGRPTVEEARRLGGPWPTLQACRPLLHSTHTDRRGADRVRQSQGHVPWKTSPRAARAKIVHGPSPQSHLRTGTPSP